MKFKKLDNKGVLGLDTAKMFVLAILTLGVIAFAVVVALSALSGSNTLPSGSQAANDTSSVLNNISTGLVSFFGNAGTWFALLAIVIIILVIAVVIVAVNRFGGRGSGNL